MTEDRYPSGRRKRPLGVREGGAAHARLHARIADAALHMLAERGYDEMTVDEVAESAQVSKRTVYRHYSTKVDLAVAGIRQLTGMFDYRQTELSAKHRLRAYLRTSDARDAVFAPVLATAVVNRNTVPELLAALREFVLEPRQALLERFIAEGQRSGEIRSDVAAPVLAALSTGLHMDHLSGMTPWLGDARRTSRVFAQVWPLLAAD